MGLFGSRPLVPYETRLPDDQEVAYERWKATLPPDLQNEGDYDLRGAFQIQASTGVGGHMTDRFKKPNHMTFSDESQYSTPTMPGGHWADAGGGRYGFWASPTNAQQHSLGDLTRYFQQNEPGNTFIAPSFNNWSLKSAPRRR